MQKKTSTTTRKAAPKKKASKPTARKTGATVVTIKVEPAKEKAGKKPGLRSR